MRPLISEVRPHRGVPWLFLNGTPFEHGMYGRGAHGGWDALWRDYRAQARAGAGLFLFPSNCASDIYERPWGEVWVDEHTFDYSHLDRYMEGFARIDPSILVMPNVMMALPPWWEARHPGELQRFYDGRTRASMTNASGSGAARNQVVSLASEAWAADMTRCLERYLDYAESRFGDRIAGYLICGGITYEWGLLGSFDFIDYSEPMRRYWRRWARDRYAGRPPYDADAIPSRELRLEAEGSFRSPARSQAAMDFQICLSDLTVQRIIGFCEAVKRRTAGRKVTATYYGYTLTCREGGLDCHGQFLGRYGCGGFQGGHLAMRTLLQSPAVDLITSPFSYQNRRLGQGDLQPHYAETSVTRHGKVSLLQDDTRSWKSPAVTFIDCGWYPEPDAFLRQLRRSFARRLCGGDLMYYLDVCGGTYDDPAVLAEVGRLQALFRRWAPWRGPADAELLVVVDEGAIAALSLDSGLQYQNVYLQSSQWALAGVPYHVMLLEDAAEADPARYPLILVTNAVRVTPALERLAARARAAGSSLLFLPGAGLLGPDGPDLEAAARLTGLPLEWVCREARRLEAGYDADGRRTRYGNERPLSHLATVSDPAAEAWSTIEGDGRPALAVRPRAGARGVDAYATVAPLPWPLIGRLADRAGCHRYGRRGERIWKSPRLLGLHVDAGGRHALTLRDGERAAEAILPPRAWIQHGRRLEADLDAHETAVFALEPGPAADP